MNFSGFASAITTGLQGLVGAAAFVSSGFIWATLSQAIARVTPAVKTALMQGLAFVLGRVPPVILDLAQAGFAVVVYTFGAYGMLSAESALTNICQLLQLTQLCLARAGSLA
ncbi:Uu.00g080690.m01.CDS01 [Anthostomella pinea]|uniref:Uu.00g080690.m01.CDS01 n=1 Tax=Anthostomella pinea TaxID=933095 RepID=A0AAI8VL45_9PEZI|nr:Uu.00g080690.m01.CDS01 [Anthostomella pinea]